MRTSRADRNYLSCSEHQWQWYAGTPDAQPAESLSDGCVVAPARPDEWDAILKISRTQGLRLTELSIAQGRENALDINNRCGGVWVSGDWGITGQTGDQIVTVKGGSVDITLRGTIYSRGRLCDVYLGQWSDQSTDKVSRIDLVGLKRADGKPVTVILARVDRSTLHLPPGAKVLWFKSVCGIAYWWTKRVYVALLSLAGQG